MRRNEGMTLLELMMVVAILTSVLGLLFLLSGNLQRSVAAQEAKVSTQDDVRMGMEILMRELRQSARSTIPWNTLPAGQIVYRRAEDVDGNGTAVDVGTFLELGAQKTIQRDLDDANGDGVTATQLVILGGNTVQVVANGILANEDVNGNGVLDGSEDTNRNGVLDRGVWFEPFGNGLRVTLQAQRRPGPRDSLVTSELAEIVVPRN